MSKLESVKVALIGAGGMANRVHYPSITQFSDVEIVGLCDVDTDKLRSTAEKFGIKNTFTNYQEMLDKTAPDAVYALMPPHHLYDVAADVLQRGHHLFIEKPPAVTTHQTVALARLAKSKNLVTGVGWQRRFHPLVRATWERVKAIGPIQQVTVGWYKFIEPSEVHPYYRGAIDILYCDASHALDALRYYAGLGEVVSVRSNVRKLDCWFHTAFTAVVQFDNGVEAVLLANWRSGRRVFKFEFHGFGGLGFADIDGEGCVYEKGAAEPIWKSDFTTEAGSDKEHDHQGFYAENREFIDAVKTGKPSHHCLEDAVKTMALADAIHAASMSDEPVVT